MNGPKRQTRALLVRSKLVPDLAGYVRLSLLAGKLAGPGQTPRAGKTPLIPPFFGGSFPARRSVFVSGREDTPDIWYHSDVPLFPHRT
jgi:hypothetical protein